MKAQETPYFTQTAWRTLAVLEALSQTQGGLGVSDLSRKLDSPKASLYPILRTMEASGYIRRRAKGVYVLTSRILDLAQGYFTQNSFTEIFNEVSRALVPVLEETMQMAVLDDTEVVYVAKRECDRPVRLVSEVGRRLPAHATALGKCLLATLDDVEIERRYQAPALPMLTANTIGSVPALRKELKKVRAAGYAEDWEEASEGLCCVAAPVAGADGEVVAAVSLSLPLHRAGADRWPRLREQLRAAAGEISKRLGGDGSRYRAEPGGQMVPKAGGI